jgi:hypothetical protein
LKPMSEPPIFLPIGGLFHLSRPPFLIAASAKTATVQSFLTASTKWIADCYDEGSFGLAHVHATPAEEAAYFLGSPFDFIELRERSECPTRTTGPSTVERNDAR